MQHYLSVLFVLHECTTREYYLNLCHPLEMAPSVNYSNKSSVEKIEYILTL